MANYNKPPKQDPYTINLDSELIESGMKITKRGIGCVGAIAAQIMIGYAAMQIPSVSNFFSNEKRYTFISHAYVETLNSGGEENKKIFIRVKDSDKNIRMLEFEYPENDGVLFSSKLNQMDPGDTIIVDTTLGNYKKQFSRIKVEDNYVSGTVASIELEVLKSALSNESVDNYVTVSINSVNYENFKIKYILSPEIAEKIYTKLLDLKKTNKKVLFPLNPTYGAAIRTIEEIEE